MAYQRKFDGLYDSDVELGFDDLIEGDYGDAFDAAGGHEEPVVEDRAPAAAAAVGKKIQATVGASQATAIDPSTCVRAASVTHLSSSSGGHEVAAGPSNHAGSSRPRLTRAEQHAGVAATLSSCYRFFQQFGDQAAINPLHTTKWIRIHGGFAILVSYQLMQQLLDIPDGTFDVQPDVVLQQQPVKLQPGAAQILDEALRVHGHKPTAADGSNPFADELFIPSMDTTKAPTVMPSPGNPAQLPRIVFQPDGLPVGLMQQAVDWKQDKYYFKIDQYCCVPGCPSSRRISFSLADLAQPSVYDGTQYVWIRCQWGKTLTAADGSRSSKTTHVLPSTLGTCGCVCDWSSPQGAGYHSKKAKYGTYRPVHDILQNLNRSQTDTAAKIAGQQQLIHQTQHSHLADRRDFTGVPSDRTAEYHRRQRQQQIWLRGVAPREALEQVQRLSIEQHAVQLSVAALHQKGGGFMLGGVHDLRLQSGGFSFQLSSKQHIIELVEVTEKYGIGLSNDFSAGITGLYYNQRTKVWAVTLPHWLKIRVIEGKPAARTKGTSPLIVSLYVTTSGTGYDLSKWWLNIKEQIQAVKPGHSLPYVIGDMAKEEANGFMQGYNSCRTAEYTMQLESLLLKLQSTLVKGSEQATAAIAALDNFYLRYTPYFWDLNHPIHTVVRHSKQHRYPDRIRWLLYSGIKWAQQQTSLFTVYEGVSVLTTVLNRSHLPLSDSMVLDLSTYTPERMRKALAMRLADFISVSMAVAQDPSVLGFLFNPDLQLHVTEDDIGVSADELIDLKLKETLTEADLHVFEQLQQSENEMEQSSGYFKAGSEKKVYFRGCDSNKFYVLLRQVASTSEWHVKLMPFCVTFRVEEQLVVTKPGVSFIPSSWVPASYAAKQSLVPQQQLQEETPASKYLNQVFWPFITFCTRVHKVAQALHYMLVSPYVEVVFRLLKSYIPSKNMPIAEFALLMAGNPLYKGSDDVAVTKGYMQMQLQRYKNVGLASAGSKRGKAVADEIRLAAGLKKESQAHLDLVKKQQSLRPTQHVTLAGQSDLGGMASFSGLLPAPILARAQQQQSLRSALITNARSLYSTSSPAHQSELTNSQQQQYQAPSQQLRMPPAAMLAAGPSPTAALVHQQHQLHPALQPRSGSSYSLLLQQQQLQQQLNPATAAAAVAAAGDTRSAGSLVALPHAGAAAYTQLLLQQTQQLNLATAAAAAASGGTRSAGSLSALSQAGASAYAHMLLQTQQLRQTQQLNSTAAAAAAGGTRAAGNLLALPHAGANAHLLLRHTQQLNTESAAAAAAGDTSSANSMSVMSQAHAKAQLLLQQIQQLNPSAAAAAAAGGTSTHQQDGASSSLIAQTQAGVISPHAQQQQQQYEAPGSDEDDLAGQGYWSRNPINPEGDEVMQLFKTAVNLSNDSGVTLSMLTEMQPANQSEQTANFVASHSLYTVFMACIGEHDDLQWVEWAKPAVLNAWMDRSKKHLPKAFPSMDSPIVHALKIWSAYVIQHGDQVLAALNNTEHLLSCVAAATPKADATLPPVEFASPPVQQSRKACRSPNQPSGNPAAQKQGRISVEELLSLPRQSGGAPHAPLPIAAAIDEQEEQQQQLQPVIVAGDEVDAAGSAAQQLRRSRRVRKARTFDD